MHPLQNGEKIKFCYLKTPNWMHENVISFIQDFPTELDLDKHVDYDLQFSKSFIEPIKVILRLHRLGDRTQEYT